MWTTVSSSSRSCSSSGEEGIDDLPPSGEEEAEEVVSSPAPLHNCLGAQHWLRRPREFAEVSASARMLYGAIVMPCLGMAFGRDYFCLTLHTTSARRRSGDCVAVQRLHGYVVLWLNHSHLPDTRTPSQPNRLVKVASGIQPSSLHRRDPTLRVVRRSEKTFT